jgi:hypothetical protein
MSKPTPAAIFQASDTADDFLRTLKKYNYLLLDRDNMPQPTEPTPTARNLMLETAERYARKGLIAHHSLQSYSGQCGICKLPLDFGVEVDE